MSDIPKLATEDQLKSVADTFTELYNHQGKQIKSIESGIIDTIVPTSPAPTKRGQYVVSAVGVYVNFKDSNKQSISVTEEEFTSGAVYLIFNGSDSRKVVVPIEANGEVKKNEKRGVNGNAIFNLIQNSTSISAKFIQGTLSQSTGQDSPGVWPNRVKTDYIEAIEIEKIVCDEGFEMNVYQYDSEKIYIGNTGYYSEHLNIPINGYFRLICKKIDNSDLAPVQIDNSITIKNYRFKPLNSIEEKNNVFFENFKIPFFSFTTVGEAVTLSLSDKIELFEDILNKYPANWSKKKIGISTDGEHDIDSYSVIPSSYTCTIAITAHVHGNEKYNPCGFLGLLSSISSNYLSHPFLKWIKENVRWKIIFMCSPSAYIANTRNTGRINLNRNMDYAWVSTPDNDKGNEPYSLNEAKCIRDYFTLIKDEIDFHLDLHDIPTTNNIAYAPFQNEKWIWMNEMNEITTLLADRNDVTSIRIPYVGKFGSVTNFFNEVLGVPSMTPEHVTSWWNKFGYDLGSQIAKSTEQIVAFIYMFYRLHSNSRHTPYYTGIVNRCFYTEEFGINSWDQTKLLSEISRMTNFNQIITEGIECFMYEPTEYSRTILIVGGITEDDMNSSLVIKNSMEMISKPNIKLPMYLAHLKKCKIVFIPLLNPHNLPENELNNKFKNILAEFSPNYTQIIRGTKNTSSVKPIEVRSSSLSYLTDWTKNKVENQIINTHGIEVELDNRYSCIVLNQFESDVYKYGFLTNTWVSLVVNDIASYFKNEILI